MDKKIRRQHTTAFKTTVVLELLKENETLSQICNKYSVHPTQARIWRAKALEILQGGFNGSSLSDQLRIKDQLIEELYKQIGQLKVELDWVKKKFGLVNR